MTCLSPDQFAYFLSLIGPEHVTATLTGLLVGDAQTLWVFMTDVQQWCAPSVPQLR